MYEWTRNISDIHRDNCDPDPAIGASHIEGMGKGTGFDIGKIQRNQDHNYHNEYQKYF